MTRRDIFKLFGGASALPAVKAVESLQVSPKDTIVLKLEHRLSGKDFERIFALMKEKFPNQRVLILDKHVEIKVVRAS